MKLALSLALAAAAVSSTVAMMGDQSCDFEEKYRWEPTKQVRVVNATGPNGPFCSPSAVDNLMRFAMEFGAMTGTDMSAYFKPINAHLDQTEAQSPYFVQYPYLLDVDVLVMPGLYNSLAMGSEKVKADMKDWVSKGGRVIYTGGSDIWRYEAASFFDMGGSNMIDFAYPTSVSAPDDRPSPYYLHRGDIEGTPLCSDEWAPPVFPWIPGTSPLADAFMVNGNQVPIMGNDREQTGFRFLYTGGPNMNFSVSGHLTTAFHYSPPHDDGEFGDVIYIGYDYLPREVQGEMWENTVLGYRNLMAVALWSEEKDDNNHGGACGPAIPGLHMIQDQSGNAHLVTPHCGGDSTFLPGMPMEQCDMLRMRVPEGYPPHMQVEVYRVPFTNSPGPVMPGHMCGGGDHYGQGGEQY